MGNSAMLTGKGRGRSYEIVNGEMIPFWWSENGGFNKIIKITEDRINSGDDDHDIRQHFNISPATMRKFIKMYMSPELIAQEYRNRKRRAFSRRSKSLKGVTKSTKGKTYKEIHGDKKVKCGFKKGKDNPNYTRSKFIGLTCKDKSGNPFRSSYECKFSNMLQDSDIDYIYDRDFEHRMNLNNGKLKIVDFVLDDILIEVTGYAYPAWRDDFDVKITMLHETYPNHKIMIVSTADNIEELKEKHSHFASIFDIDDELSIINYIKS